MAACFSKFTKKKQPFDYILTSRNIKKKKKKENSENDIHIQNCTMEKKTAL